MVKKKSNKDDHPDLPRSEREAILYELDLNKYVTKHNGQFLKDDDGSLSLILEDRRIPLSYDRKDCDLARLMLDACGVSSLSPGAQAAIQRLQVAASKKASSLSIRHFSALSADHSRLYVPVHGGKPLKITAESIERVTNGDNEDKLWIEHPHLNGGAPAFNYVAKPQEQGLEKFERLLVNTQSCQVEAMRWFVAMHEGFFPFLRDFCRARLLLVHIGPTQQGKTTGAQRFTQLLGLGQVTGDYTVAALANQGDTGLLVMDNKEQANFTQELIDFCLFLATGAQRGRSTADGQQRPQASSRPAGVITSIEGAWKPELQARCIEVAYQINGTSVNRDDVEDEILKYRDEILSAMMPVFQAWLRVRGTKQLWIQPPCPGFERHLTTLAELLHAYAEMAGKPQRWPQQIIAEWDRQLSQVNPDVETEDDLEFPIKQVLAESLSAVNSSINSQPVIFEGLSGSLYVTETAALLSMLKQHPPRDLALPKNPTGFGRRLRNANFRTLKFLEQETAPQVEQLKRTSAKRPIGFFIPDDSGGGAEHG